MCSSGGLLDLLIALTFRSVVHFEVIFVSGKNALKLAKLSACLSLALLLSIN